MSDSPGEITVLLSQLPDPESVAMLARLVYHDLHQMAAKHLSRESSHISLQPTALVTEVYMRLMQGKPLYPNRAYFFGAAAQTMRRLLVDRARQRRAQRHGGAYQRVELSETHLVSHEDPTLVLMLEEALTRLQALNPQWRRIIELRFYLGLTNAEAAEVMDMGESTLRREWDLARQWLRGYLGDDPDGLGQVV